MGVTMPEPSKRELRMHFVADSVRVVDEDERLIEGVATTEAEDEGDLARRLRPRRFPLPQLRTLGRRASAGDSRLPGLRRRLLRRSARASHPTAQQHVRVRGAVELRGGALDLPLQLSQLPLGLP